MGHQEKTVDFYRRFFQRYLPCRASDIPFGCDIRLRRVICAAAREGKYHITRHSRISFLPKAKISLCEVQYHEMLYLLIILYNRKDIYNLADVFLYSSWRAMLAPTFIRYITFLLRYLRFFHRQSRHYMAFKVFFIVSPALNCQIQVR